MIKERLKKIAIELGIIACLLAILVLAASPVWAGGKPPPSPGSDARASSESISSASSESVLSVGDTNVTVPVTTGSTTMQGGDNEVNIEGNKSRAYALGMGSGTIADCMMLLPQAFLTLKGRNEFCMRIDFAVWAENPSGHTEQSVKIRCSTWVAQDVFGDTEACEEAFVTVEAPDAHEREIGALRASNKVLLARLSALEDRLSAAESELGEKARKATLEARYAVQQAQEHLESVEYRLSDEQAAELDAWEARWTK